MPIVTAQLRKEHAELLPRIEDILKLADRIGQLAPEDLRRQLYEVHAFLTNHLMPHAVAEERVLYPTVARLLGAPGATATMSRDHVEVVRMGEELDSVRVRIADGAPAEKDERALGRILYGLHAILRLHFAEEEEIYLPLIDQGLSREEAAEMFEAMEAAERDIKQSVR